MVKNINHIKKNENLNVLLDFFNEVNKNIEKNNNEPKLSKEYLSYKLSDIFSEYKIPKMSDKEIELYNKYGCSSELWNKVWNKLEIDSPNVDLVNRTHKSLPMPITICKRYTTDKNVEYECICKHCVNPQIEYWDGCSELYNKCLICNTSVWYYPDVCTLYGRRSSYVVCFFCRIPYYDKGIKNGEIYKIGIEKWNERKKNL